MRYSFVVVLIIASQMLNLSAWSQVNKIAKVHLYAYPLPSFTLTAVDTIGITYSAHLSVNIKNYHALINELDFSLISQDTVSTQLFKSEFVRLYFKLYNKKGGFHSICISQGSYLLYRHKLYRLNENLKYILRKYIPNGEYYLPMLKR